MSAAVGDTFVDYALAKDVKGASEAGIFDMGIDSEEEDRHISELERRVAAFDGKEIYITIKTIIENNWETFSKSIQYLERGERNATN